MARARVLGDAMAGDAKFLKEMRASAQGMLGKNGMAETGFDETLDGFGIVGFHDDARRDADLFEETINHETDVAAFG